MDRDQLIRLLRRSIADRRVLRAIGEVPRQLFVPPDLAELAWENDPLPIGQGQTISQPAVVARMCELLALRGDETVLDVGTGSGYHAAVLSKLCARVVSIERHAALVDDARTALAAARVENVELVVGDGSRGCPGQAPFGGINVAAAVHREVPPALVDQLADGARMVVPVGGAYQRLELLERHGERVDRRAVEAVRFVPLVEGDAG